MEDGEATFEAGERNKKTRRSGWGKGDGEDEGRCRREGRVLEGVLGDILKKYGGVARAEIEIGEE